MKCPKCKHKLTRVNVISECWQKAWVDAKGKITEYGSVEEVTDTLFIECPDCFVKLDKVVRE